MLGNQIDPIELTLVIRQVARQPLPRVIPEKTCIEVSHCYRQDQDTHLYLLEHSMDGLTPYSCNTLVIGLALQSALADWWCLHWIPEPADSSIYTVYVPQGILRGPLVPVAIRSISGHEKVLPLPPGNFGEHRDSVGQVYWP